MIAMRRPETVKILKAVVFVLILAFYASVSLYQIKLPVADDLARHIKNGEMILRGNFDVLYKNVYSYTEPDQPFTNHHWLSGVIFYLLFELIGFDGLVIFKTVVLLTAFSLLFFASLKKADFWLVAVFSIPTILLLQERTGLRPEILSFLFVALFLYFLLDLDEHPERKRVFWLIPLQVIWALLDIVTIVVLGSGLYLWLARRRSNPVEQRIAELEREAAITPALATRSAAE